MRSKFWMIQHMNSWVVWPPFWTIKKCWMEFECYQKCWMIQPIVGSFGHHVGRSNKYWMEFECDQKMFQHIVGSVGLLSRIVISNICWMQCWVVWPGFHSATPLAWFLSSAVCRDGCEHNGTCVRPDVCLCWRGWTGKSCEKGKGTEPLKLTHSNSTGTTPTQ